MIGVVAALVIMAGACTGDPSASDGDDGGAPGTAAETTGTDSAEPTATPTGVTCYRNPATTLTAVFLAVDDEASARAIPADGSDDDLVMAQGRRLDDGVWLMYSSRAGNDEQAPEPSIWIRDGDGLRLPETAGLDQVACDELTNPAVGASTGADPFDMALGDPSPVLATGSHCFADSDSHPGDDFVTLVVAADATVAADMSSMNEQNDGPALGSATGRFVSDNAVVVEVNRTRDGRSSTGWELWRIADDRSTLTYSPAAYTSYAVACG